MKVKFLFLIVVLIGTVSPQNSSTYDGYIETRKLSLLGVDIKDSTVNKVYTFGFIRNFSHIPRVGLAVYTLEFSYSPEFSIRTTQDTNQSSASVQLTSPYQNKNHRIYIMYLATDHGLIGIFIPLRIFTYELNNAKRKSSVEKFSFNFKQEISRLASNPSDITATVYLTGLATASQMTNSGYTVNKTSISLKEYHSSTKFYSIEVSIGDDYSAVLVDWVQFTVVYFLPNALIDNRYQINSGEVSLKAFGGFFTSTSKSIQFKMLEPNQNFTNLKLFFGISRIDCQRGQSITLLGVEAYYYNSKDEAASLNMETYKLTYIETATFNYLQYKQLRCSQPGANCTSLCTAGSRSYFNAQGDCLLCHYSCQSCNKSLSDIVCDTCHTTRVKSQKNNLCICKPGFYDTRDNYICTDCFPCATCEKANVCFACLENQNMVLNSITAQCQCKAGYFGNMNLDKGALAYNKVQPCLQCSSNCLYCTNATSCKACTPSTYLLKGYCLPICKPNQKFITARSVCAQYDGDLFDQEGRLDFDWDFKSVVNEMIVNLVFSQSQMGYYYTENGMEYTFGAYQKVLQNGGDHTAGGFREIFYYDDGIAMNGYTAADTLVVADEAENSGTAKVENSVQTIDEYALQSSYYGLGQKMFFRELYSNYSSQYLDQNGIPYGKYKLSTQNQAANPNFIEALSRNLLFKIENETLPYLIEGVSENHFVLRTRPSKAYLNKIGFIQLKNPALVRSAKTALQKAKVTRQIDRFDYYTSQQISSSYKLKKSNEVFVDVLWGICKYALFIGFGWPFIPIMLALQYIMSFNYIQSPLPLNLKQFLASFRDFRNPSLLYNPLRNQFDKSVLSHRNIYMSDPQLEAFDQGLDFMKNCWQFFFTPILACSLLGLLALINFLFNKCLKRDLTLISKFLLPRAPLLIAAYTLVQALPVSFFFFTQIKDTTFRHPFQPNIAYPTFNTAMAYLAFFLTCAIPILLLAWLYYHFNYQTRIVQFSDAKAFHRKFINKMKDQSLKFSKAQLKDPLWGGDQTQYGTFIFGFCVFGLAIIFGFFIGFFIKNFLWQLTGILIFTVIFLAFTVSAPFLLNKIIKFFFIIFTVLMLAYLLLHAGIGSNRSIETTDLWNTGFLGIGILYALLVTAIMLTAYLFYKFLEEAYQNHKKYGLWINLNSIINESFSEKNEVQRVTEYRKDTKLKSKFLKNGLLGIVSSSNINQGNPQQRSATLNLDKSKVPPLDEVPQSNDRIISSLKFDPQKVELQQLVFSKQNPYKKEISFVSKNNNYLYTFPFLTGKLLLENQPIFIDSSNKIYNKNKNFIDDYFNLSKKVESKMVSKKNFEEQQTKTQIKIGSKQKQNQNIAVQSPLKQNSARRFVLYNDQQYIDCGYDPYLKVFKLINSKTDQVQKIQKNRYINLMQQSLEKRISIGADQFDYQGTDKYGEAHLINCKNQRQITLPKQEFEKCKRQSIQDFHQQLQKQLSKSFDKPSIVVYQGEQYENYGLDQQNRIRLYNPKLQKHLLVNENQFKWLPQVSKGIIIQSQAQIQPLFRTIKRESSHQIGEALSASQDQGFIVFQQQGGQKLYIPKGKIDPNQPIQVDEKGNIFQKGIFIMNMNSAKEKSIQSKPRTTRSTKTLRSYDWKPQQIQNEHDRKDQPRYDQLQSNDAININSNYKIVGIPKDKVVDLEYQPSNVVFEVQGIKGIELIKKIQEIQQKYPNLMFFVKNQKDQTEQFWIERI